MALALLPLLSALASAPHPLDDAIPAVHGGFAAPTAWLALWRGEAWICWDPGGERWQRLELAGVVDLASLRAEFVDRSTLVVGDGGDATWLIARGDPTPRIAAWTTTPRHSPRVHACGPAGDLPVADATGLRRKACVATSAQRLCVRPGRPLRLRPASPLRVRIGFAVQAGQRWQTQDLATTNTGVQLLAIVDIGLDVAAWIQQRRERADLQAQARPDLRALPPPRSRGALASAEDQALAAALCGGAR
jgi:hypothetical protein